MFVTGHMQVTPEKKRENRSVEDEQKKKKRTKIEHTLVKNVRKTKKLRGQSYTSSTGKIMSPNLRNSIVIKSRVRNNVCGRCKRLGDSH